MSQSSKAFPNCPINMVLSPWTERMYGILYYLTLARKSWISDLRFASVFVCVYVGYVCEQSLRMLACSNERSPHHRFLKIDFLIEPALHSCLYLNFNLNLKQVFIFYHV